MQSAELGNAQAACHLSEVFDESGDLADPEQCRYWRQKSMELGGVKHAMRVAKVYQDIEEYAKSRRKYIKSAAKLGNEVAHAMLNRCHGPGCDKIDPTGKEFKSCKCKLAIYCSTECYQRHWTSGHKKECQRK